MSTLPKRFFTVEEYLATESEAAYKSEYVNGEILAMSGVSHTHDRINMQLFFLVMQHLRGKGCEPFSGEILVQVIPQRMYCYPDLSVVCEKPKFVHDRVDALTNPVLLVEILSPTTESYDRKVKAKHYRAMPSLQELLFISQDSYEVEIYRRGPNRQWTFEEAAGLESSIELGSIGYVLRLRDLYERVVAAGGSPESHQP